MFNKKFKDSKILQENILKLVENEVVKANAFTFKYSELYAYQKQSEEQSEYEIYCILLEYYGLLFELILIIFIATGKESDIFDRMAYGLENITKDYIVHLEKYTGKSFSFDFDKFVATRFEYCKKIIDNKFSPVGYFHDSFPPNDFDKWTNTLYKCLIMYEDLTYSFISHQALPTLYDLSLCSHIDDADKDFYQPLFHELTLSALEFQFSVVRALGDTSLNNKNKESISNKVLILFLISLFVFFFVFFEFIV